MGAVQRIKARGKKDKQLSPINESQSDCADLQFEDDEHVIQSLAQEVLSKIIDADDVAQDDVDSCDASSVDLDEEKRTKVSPIKRNIDKQHQMNTVQKEFLGAYFSNYDDMLERRRRNDEIDLLTGIVKPYQGQSREQVMTNAFNEARREEELFELQQLKGVPIRGNFTIEEMQDYKKMMKTDAQKYLM